MGNKDNSISQKRKCVLSNYVYCTKDGKPFLSRDFVLDCFHDVENTKNILIEIYDKPRNKTVCIEVLLDCNGEHTFRYPGHVPKEEEQEVFSAMSDWLKKFPPIDYLDDTYPDDGVLIYFALYGLDDKD